MNPNDQTSLTRLYEQRKLQHRAPESLKASLLNRVPEKSRRARWAIALPGVAASLLVVMIVLPSHQPEERMLTSLPLDALSESASYEDLAPSAPSPLAKSAPAPTVSTNREAGVAQSSFASQPSETEIVAQAETAERSAVAKPVAAPEMARVLADEADISVEMLADDEQMPSAPMAESLALTMTENAKEQPPLWLQVVDGQAGSFLDCAGKPLQLDVETDFKPGVWLRAFRAEQGEWQFEALERSPCAQ